MRRDWLCKLLSCNGNVSVLRVPQSFFLTYTGLHHHSAEGGEMLRCGNYIGFLFQVDMSWHVNSVQGLSRHTAVTRPTQESENTEGTVAY
eukprot:scaffold76767_cov37-Attheya_sp.AAC.1